MQEIILQLQQRGVENIDEKIRQKQEKYHYLLTEDAAARIIAIENGVKTEKKENKLITPLQNLKQGDRVTNVFKIHQFNEPKTFSHNNRQGNLAAINLKHNSGECTLVLWNHDANKFLESNYNINDGILISDAVVKNVNPLEIHGDLLTRIEPANVQEISDREVKKVQLSKLAPSEELITVNAFLNSIGSVKMFQKQNGQQGKMLRLMLESEEAKVPLVCWGEYAEIAKNLQNRSEATLTDVKAKVNKLNNDIELHTTPSTRLVTSGKTMQVNAKQTKINSIAEGQTCLVEATVQELKEVKTIKLCEKCFTACKTDTCQCGGKATDTVVAEAIIADDSDAIVCTFFDSRALQLLEMKSIAPDIANTVGELKKEAIKGKKVNLLIIAKYNNFLNQLKANCRQVL